MKTFLRIPYLIALIGTIGLVVLYYFGGPVWRPLKARLLGEKTVGQVMEELQPSMDQRFPDLEGLTDGWPITILAFKDEELMEIWKERDTGWQLVCSYPFTGFSGEPGPKLEEGDGQIPEGIYQVEYLNPNSSFHLSIKLDYPNDFDREMAKSDGREQLGDDIFIHGSTATVGCIPIGDDNIEELFYLIAKNGFQKTNIIITPCDFRRGKSQPMIDGIDWEGELYQVIVKELHIYSISQSKGKSVEGSL